VQDRQLEKMRILIFDVDWSADVHQLTDGRYKLRVGDRNMPFPAQDIAALKESRRRRATEIQIVPDATLNDVDLDLVRRLALDDGERRSPAQVLERYRLVESRDRRLAVSLAALVLFGKDPGRWHPRCGIDFVRYAGTDRQVGAAFNVTRRDRIEGPLFELPRLAFTTIRSQVRERQPLVDLFFEEQLEYPTFAWQEALVNAIAHRDYRFDGLGIEVWMFDDRLEVRSPGELVEPVTLE
jgi:ATP-dependent DNA helicase RecG